MFLVCIHGHDPEFEPDVFYCLSSQHLVVVTPNDFILFTSWQPHQPTPDPQVWLKMKEAMKQEVRWIVRLSNDHRVQHQALLLSPSFIINIHDYSPTGYIISLLDFVQKSYNYGFVFSILTPSISVDYTSYDDSATSTNASRCVTTCQCELEKAQIRQDLEIWYWWLDGNI